jgi:signal transduction histidine kinase
MNQYNLLDHLLDPVLVLDAAGELCYFNHQSTVFFRLSPRLLKQKRKLDELFGPEAALAGWLDGARAKSDAVVSPEINIQLTSDPDTQYHVIIKAVPAEEGKLVLFFRDMTVERTLHLKYREKLEELKRTHGQILQADKLATIGELTANISHEINNPLTIAAGHSEIIKDYLKHPDQVKMVNGIQKANQTVIESLDRVNQIIRDMQDFLHKNEDKKEYCDLNDVINSAIEWVNPAIKNNEVSVEVHCEPAKYVVLANKTKLEQVMINLIKNAIDAMAEAASPERRIQISVMKSEADQRIYLNVTDTGPGVDSAIETDLFRPFSSTKEEGQGSGLGLSICTKIIEAHQGTIEYVKDLPGGHFRIGLPLIETYSYTRNDKFQGGINKDKRVLVLDNEVQILNVLNAFIQDEQMVFIGSSDPLDALDFLDKADVDLIITDFSMPGMDGDEFVKRARTQGFKGPVLYMTSAKNVDVFNRDKKELGIKGLLLKPFNQDEVMKAVNLAIKDQ